MEAGKPGRDGRSKWQLVTLCLLCPCSGICPVKEVENAVLSSLPPFYSVWVPSMEWDHSHRRRVFQLQLPNLETPYQITLGVYVLRNSRSSKLVINVHYHTCVRLEFSKWLRMTCIPSLHLPHPLPWC